MIIRVHNPYGSISARLPRRGSHFDVLRFSGRNPSPSTGGPYAHYLREFVGKYGTRRVMRDDFEPPKGWTWPEYARARGWLP